MGPLTAAMTEAEWQAKVLGAARLFGWAWYHAPDNRPGKHGQVQRIVKGFPDLVLIRERIVVAELKSAKGRVMPEQVEWLDRFRAAGAEAYLWRPADWPEVMRVLDRPS